MAAACARGTRPEYFATESTFMRVGVDRKEEERAVRHVLAQRKLDVVSEVRSSDFVAWGAQSLDGKVSAVRVMTDRGVVIAEDAHGDDLFAPGTIALLEAFPARYNDLALVGFVRTRAGKDAGCVSLRRILADGSVVDVVLDVSTLGSRACVLTLARGPRQRLSAEVGFPELSGEQTASLRVELAFQTVPLGKPDPIVRVARLAQNGELLDAERNRLQAAACAGAPMAARQAVAVARAAVSSLVGDSTDRQVAAYRECIGTVQAGSSDAELLAETVKHLQRGWLDSDKPKGEAADAEATAADPVEVQSSQGEPDGIVIEPDAPAARE